ncbi:MAG: hypothetical protein JXA87_02205 [Thermoleophilia bacterium]|nr:hypothetical protein [Thermoleophilia bacterium]
MTGPDRDPSAAAELAETFNRRGYVRRQNAERAADVGWKRYKKGDEVRIPVSSQEDLEHLRDLLVRAGFSPGTPYSQGGGWRQPLYGRKQVAAFLEMVDAATPPAHG